jgi:hypothetical protein
MNPIKQTLNESARPVRNDSHFLYRVVAQPVTTGE